MHKLIFIVSYRRDSSPTACFELCSLITAHTHSRLHMIRMCGHTDQVGLVRFLLYSSAHLTQLGAAAGYGHGNN